MTSGRSLIIGALVVAAGGIILPVYNKIYFDEKTGFEQGFEQGINYQKCLSEVDESKNGTRDLMIGAEMSFQEYQALRNKCEEEYGLK